MTNLCLSRSTPSNNSCHLQEALKLECWKPMFQHKPVVVATIAATHTTPSHLGWPEIPPVRWWTCPQPCISFSKVSSIRPGKVNRLTGYHLRHLVVFLLLGQPLLDKIRDKNMLWKVLSNSIGIDRCIFAILTRWGWWKERTDRLVFFVNHFTVFQLTGRLSNEAMVPPGPRDRCLECLRPARHHIWMVHGWSNPALYGRS